MKLPDWMDIREKITNGKEVTALEKFIYDNEPAGNDDENKFRTELEAVLYEHFDTRPGFDVSDFYDLS